MRLIGITGGIGTGKSTVTNYLHSRYHLPIWDADIYARSAVAVGSPILTAISQHYGDDILRSDGTLDRPRLGEIIFSNLVERQWLESQIHPYVRHCFDREISRLQPDATAVLAIPLLFEAKITDLVTEIWVVSCDLSTQIERVMKRDRIDKTAAIKRIESQMPLADKIALADVNLDNSTNITDLERQIDLKISNLI
ncbi:dephospho-CoA kinase [Chamaesiphon polymorphus]|uniref:Dephospho-CoA kinase n=1 Tax=Chamaesiphon polymorphus CCALA 037 TaxID=2107692 RepID=A0A2T1GDY2_9CYAN|nr:dephospho-CoA kinase [Chamaesiphon polymorphus]PSB55664.1 dephospho-CoA kinase [Chamaesiphon polymorphus CCALA 037]